MTSQWRITRELAIASNLRAEADENDPVTRANVLVRWATEFLHQKRRFLDDEESWALDEDDEPYAILHLFNGCATHERIKFEPSEAAPALTAAFERDGAPFKAEARRGGFLVKFVRTEK